MSENTSRPIEQSKDLAQFSERLRDLHGDKRRGRPFVCEGSPLTCRVLLVGANPATTLADGFWPYWDPVYGFHKSEWFDAYMRERQNRNDGRERTRPMSNTREAIEQLLAALAPHRVLETNVYSRASRRFAALAAEDRVVEHFELLERLVPFDTVILHGAEARSYMNSKVGALPIGILEVRRYGGRDVAFVATGHLSRGKRNPLARGGSPQVTRAQELARILEPWLRAHPSSDSR